MKKFYDHFYTTLHTIITIYFDFSEKKTKNLNKIQQFQSINSMSIKQKINTITLYLKHILHIILHKTEVGEYLY